MYSAMDCGTEMLIVFFYMFDNIKTISVRIL